MTEIKILKINNQIISVECNGHTGFDEFGKDILCASISSLIQGCALGLLKVAEIKNLQIQKKDTDGYYKITIPSNISKEQQEKANVLLNTLELCLKDFVKGYPKYIKMEVKINDVY